MKPSLGWVLLSRAALSRAETQLRDDIMGVRDEIGFLLIHSGYANRFFPGTSVLHSRLRYVLFILWMYEDLLREGGHRDIAGQVSRRETKLAGRLRHLEGTIGKQSYPEPTSQPPTFVYWTALRTWGLLRRRPDGSWPTKSQLHRSINYQGVLSRLTDDDNVALDDAPEFFTRTPPPPPEWQSQDGNLTFRLPREERSFLRRQLIGVMRPNDGGRPSLLSLLAENIQDFDPGRAAAPWDLAISRYAMPDDRQALQRAHAAAAMSDVGRAVYSALVETVREQEDGLATDRLHRQFLPEVLERSGEIAATLDLTALIADLPDLPQYLRDVLAATIQWLAQPRDLMELRDTYAHAEEIRKGRRARLSKRLSGRERRAEWQPGQQARANPIGYRWANVNRLLRDLKGEE